MRYNQPFCLTIVQKMADFSYIYAYTLIINLIVEVFYINRNFLRLYDKYTLKTCRKSAENNY